MRALKFMYHVVLTLIAWIIAIAFLMFWLALVVHGAQTGLAL